MSDISDTDRRILDELEHDARASVAAIAERVHISRAQAYGRIRKLEEDGVIRGYGARVDPVLSGLKTSAYVTLTVDQRNWQELFEQLSAIPEVKHVALVGGDFDVLLLVRARDNQDLRRVVLGGIQSLEHVTGSKTLIIFEDHAV